MWESNPQPHVAHLCPCAMTVSIFWIPSPPKTRSILFGRKTVWSIHRKKVLAQKWTSFVYIEAKYYLKRFIFNGIRTSNSTFELSWVSKRISISNTNENIVYSRIQYLLQFHFARSNFLSKLNELCLSLNFRSFNFKNNINV